MRITAISAYQVSLPVREGRYTWAGGSYVEEFDSTVVEIMTDEGIVGFGEICPLGPAYLPAYAAGARAGIAEVAPRLLGLDPRDLGTVNCAMDQAMRGHPYVKSALDIACWDILGKATGLPVATLLGGIAAPDVRLYRAISQDSPEGMAANVAGYRSEGYSKFQLKVGGDPDLDIARIRAVAEILGPDDVLVADANTGWVMHEAMRVVHGIRDLNVYVEQPCLTYEECLSVRRHTSLPFILDEVIDGVPAVVRGASDAAMDVVNLKISKVGGLTKARQVRDLCVTLGLAMTIEDSWGGDITTAAIAHLAQSTPEKFLFSTTDFNSYVSVSIADGGPRRVDGRMSVSRDPGLGVVPRMDVLGAPVMSAS